MGRSGAVQAVPGLQTVALVLWLSAAVQPAGMARAEEMTPTAAMDACFKAVLEMQVDPDGRSVLPSPQPGLDFMRTGERKQALACMLVAPRPWTEAYFAAVAAAFEVWAAERVRKGAVIKGHHPDEGPVLRDCVTGPGTIFAFRADIIPVIIIGMLEKDTECLGS